MKKLIYLFLALIIVACSGEDSSDNGNETLGFQYELKRILGSKVYAESTVVPVRLGVLKQFSYTVDTLEIALNAVSMPITNVRLEIEAHLDIVTPAPNDVVVHVNFINFINFQPILEDNAIQHISLSAGYTYPYNNWFTYSESNINLSDYPDLFRRGIGSIILAVRPKVGDELEILNSSNDYNVGAEIFRDGILYKVISKQ